MNQPNPSETGRWNNGRIRYWAKLHRNDGIKKYR